MRMLITGGSGCGKSTYAEKVAVGFALPRYYVAAMRPYGEESEKKIARHRKMRAEKGFTTIEKYTGIKEINLPKGGTLLLECMCNLTANEMFDPDGSGKNCVQEILCGIERLSQTGDNLIVVTNDVGSDGALYPSGTGDYIRTLGKLNSILAAEFDVVIEMVCGIPIFLKGELAGESL